MEMSGQLHAPAALLLEMNPCTHSIGVWVGPRASQKDFGEGKISCPCRDSTLSYTKMLLQPHAGFLLVSLDKQDLKCIKMNAIMVINNLLSILGKLYHPGDFSAYNTTTYHDWKCREASDVPLRDKESPNNWVKWRLAAQLRKVSPENSVK
jgi:hypothetical protein